MPNETSKQPQLTITGVSGDFVTIKCKCGNAFSCRLDAWLATCQCGISSDMRAIIRVWRE